MLKFEYSPEELPSFETVMPHLWQFRCAKEGFEFVSITIPAGFDLLTLQAYVKDFFIQKIPKMTYFHGLSLHAVSSGVADELQEATVLDMQVTVDRILTRMETVNEELSSLFSLHNLHEGFIN